MWQLSSDPQQLEACVSSGRGHGVSPLSPPVSGAGQRLSGSGYMAGQSPHPSVPPGYVLGSWQWLSLDQDHSLCNCTEAVGLVSDPC